MAKTNRKTLKEYFGKGKKPDHTQFVDLIDSMLNVVDDGFNKSAERGMLLSPLNDDGAVMEIRRNILDGARPGSYLLVRRGNCIFTGERMKRPW